MIRSNLFDWTFAFQLDYTVAVFARLLFALLRSHNFTIRLDSEMDTFRLGDARATPAPILVEIGQDLLLWMTLSRSQVGSQIQVKEGEHLLPEERKKQYL